MSAKKKIVAPGGKQVVSAQLRGRITAQEMEADRKLMAAEAETARDAARVANTPINHMAFAKALADGFNAMDEYLSRYPNPDGIVVNVAIVKTESGDAYDVNIRIAELTQQGFDILATQRGKPLGTPKEN